MGTLSTRRLLLRRWQVADEPAIAAINRDPEVTRWLNRPTSEGAIAAFFGQMVAHWQTYGFGPWALASAEPGSNGALLGFAGLAHLPPFLAHAGDAPELGWRLSSSAWGRGLATEAALAARDHAFDTLGLEEVISIIHPQNHRSQRVATKLGMRPGRRIQNPAIGRSVEIWVLRAGQRPPRRMPI